MLQQVVGDELADHRVSQRDSGYLAVVVLRQRTQVELDVVPDDANVWGEQQRPKCREHCAWVELLGGSEKTFVILPSALEMSPLAQVLALG